jgi:hypothetical protein
MRKEEAVKESNKNVGSLTNKKPYCGNVETTLGICFPNKRTDFPFLRQMYNYIVVKYDSPIITARTKYIFKVVKPMDISHDNLST